MSSSLSAMAATDTQEAVPQLNIEGSFAPARLLLAQTVSAGVLTRIDNAGGQVTLRGSNATRNQLMRVPEDRLRVPARSGANIGFRPVGGSGTISNYLVQAGSPTTHTEYWYPCNGGSGRFVIGWSTRGGTPTCSQVRLGQTLRVPARGNTTARLTTPTLSAPSRIQTFNSPTANFPDTQGHWAEAEIVALSNQGIIAGYYEDGTFRPDAPVTRAEFAAMVNRAFGNRAPLRDERDFPDTQGHWANSAIRTAYALGFFSGYPGGVFLPQSSITRAEAVVALSSGLNLSGDGSLEGYADAPQICGSGAPYYWACNQIRAAASNGIRIKGPNVGQFRPSQRATRADIAVFIYQALEIGSGVPTVDGTDVVIEPTDADIAWVLADVTEERVEVTVLGGTVSVDTETAPATEVSAGERYTLEQNEAAVVAPLSSEERGAIANSPDVVMFLDPNSWSPETASELSRYQLYRDDLFQPDVAIKIHPTLVTRTSQSTGTIQLVATVVNQSRSSYVPGAVQEFTFDENRKNDDPNSTAPATQRNLGRQNFENLAPGETIQITSEIPWDVSSSQSINGYVACIPIPINDPNYSPGSGRCRWLWRDDINNLFR
ncbi:MAG: S-layer homology domain-containing protein [Oculatellaceae cyanobacterium bins.114]|nr:S-layer homology domain-containing protein [Oculatellaceae cyanobacterium bins.114]